MDRISEMQAFTSVVELGGFTEAAKRLGISKSAVSKHISGLEARLGATLLNRTTRQVSVTEIGQQYYDRVTGLLAEIAEADAMVSVNQKAPMGEIKISVATDFGTAQLAPLLPKFFASYPEVSIRLMMQNRVVDLVDEGIDLAIRIGDLPDSSLRARKLGSSRMTIVGAPDYFEERGQPQSTSDLGGHKLLRYAPSGSESYWHLTDKSGKRHMIKAASNLTSSDGRSLLIGTIGGLGLAYLPRFVSAEAIREGSVQEVLLEEIETRLDINVVYPQASFMQPKIRVFIDFLVAEFKAADGRLW